MSHLWAICLLIVPVIISSTLVQARDVAPCAEPELLIVQSWKTEYEALIVDMGSAQGPVDELLEYGRAVIAWRDELWSQLPRCAEAIELALAMSENIDDIAATKALIRARVSLSLIHYKDRLLFGEKKLDRVRDLFEEIDQLIENEEREKEPSTEERSLPACTDSDIDDIFLANDDHIALIDAAYAVDSVSALLDYSKMHLEWRDGLWDRLSNCEEALATGWLMSQSASDLTILISLQFAGVEREENLYISQVSGDFNKLAEWMTLLQETNELPPCSEGQFASLAGVLSEFLELTALVGQISALDEYLEYGAKQIAWRDHLWRQLPWCKEALELARAANQAASDIASVHGLYYGGIRLEDNLVWTRALENLSVAQDLARTVVEWASGKNSPRPESSGEYSVPKCTDYEAGYVFDMLEELNIIASVASDMESAKDLLEFSALQVTWREYMWTSMPVCQEAIELAWQMYQITADTVSAAAMEMFGDTPREDNLYLQQIEKGQKRIGELALALEDS